MKGLDFDNELDNPVKKLKLGKMITDVNRYQLMTHNSLKKRILKMRLLSFEGIGTNMSPGVNELLESNLM